MKRTILGWASLIVALAGATASAAVTFESLLDELTDMKRLAELPEPAYTTKQFSSYDRASKSPDVEWFANHDSGMFIRTEERDGRQEFVMMDAQGPGTIVRIWSANPDGTLRIYLDGSDQPVIQTEMKALLGGDVANIPTPLAGKRAQGWNLHLPIPYAKQCKITSDKGTFYYHVNYRTYQQGTEVRTFTAADLQKQAAKIDQVAQTLAKPREAVRMPEQFGGGNLVGEIPPDGHQTLVLEGAKAIEQMLLTVNSRNLPAAIRGTVLKIEFDGQETVHTPLGDFFASAPALTPYESLPVGVMDSTPRKLYSHWYMPFAKVAKITLHNLSPAPLFVNMTVKTTPYTWTERSLLFHAKWRIQRDLPSRPLTDWAHLEAKGKGRFVGGHLHVINRVRDWWGEGDEKIYVDGETFPSHFGTGTEDYYGYAWCSPERFVHAYHAQPHVDGPNNYGNTSVSRFHIIDDIPFTTSFKFDIENWHSHGNTTTNRAAVSYWYARPGGSDFFKPLTKEDVALDVVPEYQVMRVKGAQEGERLKVLSHKGQLSIQALGGDEWSGGQHLWWTEGKPGDKLELAFTAPKAGGQNVIVRLTRADDYAQVRLQVNGQPAGGLIDLYNRDVRVTDEIDLGRFNLKQGENTLTVEIVGANEKAKKKYMFGLDYVLVK